MNDNRNQRAGAVAVLALTMAALTAPAIGARAQTVPVPQETPRTIPGLVIATPSATPVPVPTGPVLGLPAPSPTRPVDTGTVAPDRPAAERPGKRVSPIPTPTPTPAATSTPADRPAPVSSPVTPAPAVSPTPAPTAVPTPSATTAPIPAPVDQGSSGWPWLPIAGGLVVLLGLGGWVLLRRRSQNPVVEEMVEQQPVFTAPPAVAAPQIVPAGPRARIDIALRPLRAGLNMLSAVVEAEVVVRNAGDAAAAHVRINATLLSAHAGQDADLAAVFAAPPAGRPAAPPFALAVGEERRVRVVAALSREAVRSMEAAGRPMFVPLVAIDVRYAADTVGTPARTGQAFVVGVERVDSAKLAPFWLDGPLRMYDQIAVRVQGPPHID